MFRSLCKTREHLKQLGLHLSCRAIGLFSLNDLEEGKITFVHTGLPTSRLAFRVSDGQKVSEVSMLTSGFLLAANRSVS